VFMMPAMVPDTVGTTLPPAEQVTSATSGAGSDTGRGTIAGTQRDIVIGAYGGATYTHPSAVHIIEPGRSNLTLRDVNWIGMPFKSPIYYGLRVQRWAPLSGFGSMVDFTHAKAIAVAGDEAQFEGTRDGTAVPARARIGAVFKHLEFSHGHNMLTYNGLFRWPAVFGRVRPYAGLGAGITLPHTEVGFRDKNTRTYEYQFAGFVGQLLGGLEIDLGRTSVFFEYKLSYAPYEVPLSQENGWLLVTDLWRQFKAWAVGQTPPGGRLRTNLATQHGVGGILMRVTSAPAARPR
jgi:lipid A oxidase